MRLGALGNGVHTCITQAFVPLNVTSRRLLRISKHNGESQLRHLLLFLRSHHGCRAVGSHPMMGEFMV